MESAITAHSNAKINITSEKFDLDSILYTFFVLFRTLTRKIGSMLYKGASLFVDSFMQTLVFTIVIIHDCAWLFSIRMCRWRHSCNGYEDTLKCKQNDLIELRICGNHWMEKLGWIKIWIELIQVEEVSDLIHIWSDLIKVWSDLIKIWSDLIQVWSVLMQISFDLFQIWTDLI